MDQLTTWGYLHQLKNNLKNIKVSWIDYIKIYLKYNLQLLKYKLFKLELGDTIGNKIYKNWGKPNNKIDFDITIINKLYEIRNKIFKKTLRGGPHVIILRNKAAKLWNEYLKNESKWWLNNRSYLQRLFNEQYKPTYITYFNIVTIDEPTFSKSKEVEIYDIEAIYFSSNLGFEYEPAVDSWDLYSIPDINLNEQEKYPMSNINLKLYNEPQENIIIKENV